MNENVLLIIIFLVFVLPFVVFLRKSRSWDIDLLVCLCLLDFLVPDLAKIQEFLIPQELFAFLQVSLYHKLRLSLFFLFFPSGGGHAASEQPGLLALHAVWLRQHNNLANQLLLFGGLDFFSSISNSDNILLKCFFRRSIIFFLGFPGFIPTN